MTYLTDLFHKSITNQDEDHPEYVLNLTNSLLSSALEAGVSDIHLCPSKDLMEMKWRLDGVLVSVDHFSHKIAPQITSRLKVMSDLLTYQTEIPQEGRIRSKIENREIRITTFPTVYGEKTVIRLFAESQKFRYLDDLALPNDVTEGLRNFTTETSGVILLTGPAGSGKTTTIYACLREILKKSSQERSLVSLEDPIESIIPGVDQSQVNLSVDFDMPRGLRSLLRQDPDVLMVGEIRDRSTAETVFQASLSGHLVLTTFHAGSVSQAIKRLVDIGIEPYLLQSGLRSVICQRLFRNLCSCSVESSDVNHFSGMDLQQARKPVGCEKCQGTGYARRLAIAEILDLHQIELNQDLVRNSDSKTLNKLLMEQGMVSQWENACRAISEGKTTTEEIHRVLGIQFSHEIKQKTKTPIMTET
jgi:general secretion pathway protein E